MNEHGLECPVDWEEVPTWAQYIAIGEDGTIFATEIPPVFSKRQNSWLYHPICKIESIGTSDMTPIENCIWERPSLK